jgi:hypothetical protein
MAVANLTPGTFFDPHLNIRINGAPSNTEAVRVEGQESTNGVVTFAQAETQPSVDAIQDFSVQTSNYAAEYGQAGAGVFNYTMRSGTNQFHGSLYDYNSNESYNAGQSYTHTRPKLRRNDYGGTIGGSVWIPGKTLSDQETIAIVTFLGSLTGSLSRSFVEAPVLPPAGFRVAK